MAPLTTQPLWQDTAAARTGARPEPPAPLEGRTTADVVVVGAGIVGLTTAVELARAGRDVVVLEARHVGAGTTGGSSAKVTLAQGTRFSDLAARHDAAVLTRYAEANLAGQDWLRATCAVAGLALDRCDGVSYATTADGRAALAEEQQAMAAAGLPAELTDAVPELPFATTAGLRLADQYQVDPQAYLDVLLAHAREAGVRVHAGTRVEGVGPGSPREVACTTAAGRARVRAEHVVLATGTPVLDRSGFFARLEPQRSSCVAVPAPGERPEGMYLSVDGPTRSIRRATAADGSPLLVVGGNGHPVGQVDGTAALLQDLEHWARTTLGTGPATHRWAAQDYRTPDGLPFVGRFEPWSRDLWVATGFAKWGLTSGTAAALALVGHLTGRPVPWAGDWDPWRGDVVAQAPGTAVLNATVAKNLATGWVGALSGTAPDPAEVGEGDGRVGRDGRRPVGVSRVDGVVRTVSAVCPHLGGILRWNDAEASWDCPLHGSRFAADGARLEGPATCGLARLDSR